VVEAETTKRGDHMWLVVRVDRALEFVRGDEHVVVDMVGTREVQPADIVMAMAIARRFLPPTIRGCGRRQSAFRSNRKSTRAEFNDTRPVSQHHEPWLFRSAAKPGEPDAKRAAHASGQRRSAANDDPICADFQRTLASLSGGSLASAQLSKT